MRVRSADIRAGEEGRFFQRASVRGDRWKRQVNRGQPHGGSVGRAFRAGAQLKMGKLTLALKRGGPGHSQDHVSSPGPQPLACWERHAVLEGRGTTHGASLILKVRGTGPTGWVGNRAARPCSGGSKGRPEGPGGQHTELGKETSGMLGRGGRARVTGRVGSPRD